MSNSEDRIERDITIATTVERVWEVITTPEHFATWFGSGAPVDIDLRPGGEMTLDHGAHGRYRAVVVEVDPPHRFSYRWAAGYPEVKATEASSTLVEFTLTSVGPELTRLRVVESGFADLVVPEGREWMNYENHLRGWNDVLAKAAGYAEGRDLTPMVAPR